MDMVPGVFDFSAHKGSGPRTLSAAFAFPRRVLRATAVITGHTAQFTTSDHEFGRLTVHLSSQIIHVGSGSEVRVTGTFGLRDWSGNWDDSYNGQIRYVVLAEQQGIFLPDLKILARAVKTTASSSGARRPGKRKLPARRAAKARSSRGRR